MRLLILFAFLIIIDWFSFQGVRVLTQGLDRNVRLGIHILFWAIPVLSMAFIWASVSGLTESWPKSLRVMVSAFIMIIYFSKFVMGVVILIDDIRRGIMWVISQFSSGEAYSPSRSRFLSQLGLALGAMPFLSLTYGLIRNPYRYKVYTEKIPLKALKPGLKGLRIVQISDIHSGSFLHKEPVERSVEMINQLKPDVVFFTGDLVNSKADEMDDFIDVFSKIESRFGVYSILGNHDYGDYHEWPTQEAKQANFEYLKTQHQKLGWDLLLNEHRTIDVNGARVGIIGVENYSANRRFHKYGDLNKAVDGLPETDVKILLSHDPSHWNDQVITDFNDIDITLSGHTHGFQFGVEIPGYLKWSPVQYVYKEWAGLYQKDQQYLYVNRGLGYLGYPGRVGILPEITMIELEPAV